MPLLLILAGTGLVGVLGLSADRVLDQAGDTTDRIAPTVMMVGGAVALAGAVFIAMRGRK